MVDYLQTKASQRHAVAEKSDTHSAGITCRSRRLYNQFWPARNGSKVMSSYSVADRDGRSVAGASARRRSTGKGTGAKIEHWTHHDLRRTMATRMAESGTAPHIIEAVLNHISGHKAGVAGIYNRASYEPQKRIALEKWAEHLAALVSGKHPAKVVKLHRG